MTTLRNSWQQAAKWPRWIALAIATLAAGFWLLILLDIVACDVIAGFVCVSWENVLLLGLVAASALSVLTAWWRECLGGLALSLWGLTFTIIAYVTSSRPHQVSSILVSGAPFLTVSLMLLGSWRLRRCVREP